MRPWCLCALPQFLRLVLSAFHLLAAAASAAYKSRAALHLENLALRHQLGVLRRSVKRPKLTSADRFVWTWLCEVWSDWRSALVIVKPETVIAWHRKGIDIGETSVGKYIVRTQKPPSQTGVPSRRITSRPWFRSTSLPCRPFGFRSYDRSCFGTLCGDRCRQEDASNWCEPECRNEIGASGFSGGSDRPTGRADLQPY